MGTCVACGGATGCILEIVAGILCAYIAAATRRGGGCCGIFPSSERAKSFSRTESEPSLRPSRRSASRGGSWTRALLGGRVVSCFLRASW